MHLRPYQLDLVAAVSASFASGHSAPLVVLPTGGGKTATAIEMVRKAVDNGKRVVWLAHRAELCKQTVKAAERYVTPALKEYEERVLTATERIDVRERELVDRLRQRVGAGDTKRLRSQSEIREPRSHEDTKRFSESDNRFVSS